MKNISITILLKIQTDKDTMQLMDIMRLRETGTAGMPTAGAPEAGMLRVDMPIAGAPEAGMRRADMPIAEVP
jgi:hypothetical protein